jgi:hypothetical protein
MLAAIQFTTFQYAIKKVTIKICTIVILPVVLHGCEASSLMFRGKRMTMHENMMLRRKPETKRDEAK